MAMLSTSLRLCALLLAFPPLVSSFVVPGNLPTQQTRATPIPFRDSRNILMSTFKDDEFELRSEAGSQRPETSFGADAVPEAQRPANEYLDLIRQPFFAWADQERGNTGLAIRLAVVYFVSFFLVCFPISGATYTQDGFLLQKIASSNVGSLALVLLLLVRIYTGWGYIGSRLKSKVIEYEETGWYDGDIEYKNEAEKARDLFLYRSDVQPVEERLKKFTIAAGCLWIASCIGLNVATASKPVFDEYNPEMLKTLQYDDKIANIAAKQSNGKPTYCDNRYYRAVANGGQGCN
mmetsp:Transcript_25577/g.34032  ORF Transcript_25577/g.34032 Transcript_25577/m.34032 type:complete len:292 (+) Transcript_25577:89-964(+)